MHCILFFNTLEYTLFSKAVLLRPVVESLGVAPRAERALPARRALHLRLRRRRRPLRRPPRRPAPQRPPRPGHELDAVDTGQTN